MELSRYLNLSLTVIAPFALRCAAELKIPDRLHAFSRPMPLNELASSIPIAPEKEPMLEQVMRLLVHRGVFAQSEEGYMLTPISELMLTEGSNMGAHLRLVTDPNLINEAFAMGDWFKSKDAGGIYEMKNGGKSFWESTKQKPDFGKSFNGAMASHSKKLVKDVVASCPQVFEGLKSLVDVGGGTAASVQIIAETFPKLRCTVFDLPHVISNATKSEIFHATEGNMFEKIPAADAVMLKNILHNWSDEDCVKILDRCREAIPPAKAGGKVIIVDLAIDLESHDSMAVETSLCYDLVMMISFGSKERSVKEWHNIFQAADFVNYNVHPVGIYSVYELFP